MEKHKDSLGSVVKKKKRISMILFALIFQVLGVIIMFTSYLSGLMIFIFGTFLPVLLVYQLVSKRYSKVIKIELLAGVPRINFEYWDKETVDNLPREYFWRYKNKAIPVIDSTGEAQTWFNPFLKERIPKITSGDLYRTLIQDSARTLFQSTANQWAEVAKIGLFGLMAVGGALYLIMVLNQGGVVEGPDSINTPPPPIIEEVPDNLSLQPQGQNMIMPLRRSETKNYGYRSKEIW